MVKEFACQCKRHRRCGFSPWVGKISERRKRKPVPVFSSKKPMDREAWQVTIHRIAESGMTEHTRRSLLACDAVS